MMCTEIFKKGKKIYYISLYITNIKPALKIKPLFKKFNTQKFSTQEPTSRRALQAGTDNPSNNPLHGNYRTDPTRTELGRIIPNVYDRIRSTCGQLPASKPTAY